ncbi:MAG: hypothetical protein ABL925_07230 [Methylococcales bacterium]
MTIVIDATEAEALLTRLPRQIDRAMKSAVDTTTTWAKKEEQSRMAARLNIPKSIFTKVRVKGNTNRDRTSGLVWMGIRPVKSGFVGKLSQIESGAFAREYFFQGGFIATMRSGHKGIFKRVVRQSLPIREETVNLDVGVDIRNAVAAETQTQLAERFLKKLNQLTGSQQIE